MPWSEKQAKVLRAREHGWQPRPGGPFENVSPKKAGDLLGEAKARKEGQKRAITRSMA